MERRLLGGTDMDVSVLGFGGSEIGYGRSAIRTVERLLGSALDAGLNVIDTAECYDDGEERIGRAVGARRREFYLFTKCGHPRDWSRGDWRPASLLGSLERSLTRLRTDHVDLIQLHSCSIEVLRKGDAVAALERARERGWTRYVGYSGDGEAARYAIECGRFDTLQTSVSIADQEALDLTLPPARARNLGVIAKRPLANAVWRHARKPGSYYEDYWRRLRALDYPFLRGAGPFLRGAGPFPRRAGPLPRGAPAAGVALRFTLSAPGVHTAIVGTARPDRWQENAAALAAGPLPADDFAAIRARWREVAGASWVGQE